MTNWTLTYDSFEPEEEGLREALTSTGNGYFCTRGTLAWAEADGTSYPGTYTHGGYNRETTIMAGVPVLNEDLVNLPNWLSLELRIEGEEAVGMDNVELLSYQPRVRHPVRHGQAHDEVPRPGGPGDHAGEPALREHGRHAPGGHAVDHHAGELVGHGRGDLGARRQGHEQGRRPLPASSKAGTSTPSPPGPSVPRSSPWRSGPASRTSTSPRPPAPASGARWCGPRWTAASTRCRTTSTRFSPSRSRRASPCTSRRWSPSTPRATPL